MRTQTSPQVPLPDGCLTLPDGLPDGSNFCKSLQSRKVDGLTAQIPPGRLYCMPLSGLPPRSSSQSNPVQPSPTGCRTHLIKRSHHRSLLTPFDIGTLKPYEYPVPAFSFSTNLLNNFRFPGRATVGT